MQRRTAARTVGLLFITATVTGVLSTVFLTEDATGSPASLIAHRTGLTVGALLVLIMTAAIAMIPPALFPVLRRHSEALALSYVVARTVEVALLAPAAVGPLLLLAVASEYGPDDEPQFELARSLTMSYDAWGHPVSTVFFCLGVVILNWVLMRFRLVPRALSMWGLLSAGPYLADGILVMFDRLATPSLVHALLVLPLALYEMALAVWLLVKGFLPTPAPAPVGSPGPPDADRPADASHRGLG